MNKNEFWNDKDLWLRSQIEAILLDFAPLYEHETTSDLQGIAMVKAQEIIHLVRKS